MTIDWINAQTLLGVKRDGNPGPLTYGALLSSVAGRQVDPAYGQTLATNAARYGIDATAKRLSAFVGQSCLESGRFRYTRELWSPTDAQRLYDAPGNPLGNHPGDGFKMRGAGWIQVTGRDNLTAIGRRLAIDLIGTPGLLDDVRIGCLISLEWWKMNGANAVADTRDTLAVSKLVNRGSADSTRMPLGAAERQGYTDRAMGVLA